MSNTNSMSDIDNDKFSTDCQNKLNYYNTLYQQVSARLSTSSVTLEEMSALCVNVKSILRNISQSISLCKHIMEADTHNAEVLKSLDFKSAASVKLCKDVKEALIKTEERYECAKKFQSLFETAYNSFMKLLNYIGADEPEDYGQKILAKGKEVTTVPSHENYSPTGNTSDASFESVSHALDPVNNSGVVGQTSQIYSSNLIFQYKQSSLNAANGTYGNAAPLSKTAVANPFIKKNRSQNTKFVSEEDEHVKQYVKYDSNTLTELNGSLTTFYNHDDVCEWSKSRYTEWRSALSEDDVEEFRWYSSNGYESINPQLRGGEITDRSTRAIKRMSIALGNAKLPEDVVVFRAIGEDGVKGLQERLGGRIEKGAVLSDKAFLSTALTYDVDFCHYYPCVLRLTAPSGTHAAPLTRGDLSVQPREAELLFQKDSRIFVKSVIRCTRGDVLRNGDNEPITVIDGIIYN